MIPQKWETLPYLKQKNSKEWSASCPKCGSSGHIGSDDPDRFIIRVDEPGVRGWCRKCHHFEWGDESPEAAEARKMASFWPEERTEKEKTFHERYIGRVKTWNDSMTERHREYWRNSGIPDPYQDYWKLGFTSYQYTDRETGEIKEYPAGTIPYWYEGWRLTNVQYRLVNGNERYMLTKDVPATVFNVDPDLDTSSGVPRTLLLEGVKKAIVTYMHIGHVISCMYAMPSAYVSEKQARLLPDSDEIIILFDPDVTGKTKWRRHIKDRLKSKTKNIKVASLHGKVDDLLLANTLDPKSLVKILDLARRL